MHGCVEVVLLMCMAPTSVAFVCECSRAVLHWTGSGRGKQTCAASQGTDRVLPGPHFL